MTEPRHDTATFDTTDPAALAPLAHALASAIRPGLQVHFSGELGAGKTTLIREILRALGFEGKVKSPTYSLLESYEISGLYLYHFDLYRVTDPAELEQRGFRELFGGPGVCFVEWPERAAGWLPEPDLTVRMEFDDGRRTTVSPSSEVGNACMIRLKRG